MGCPDCEKKGHSHSGEDCGCESCFTGVTIPFGPEGPKGETGATGEPGQQGPQGEPGEDAIIPPLVWTNLALMNDWQATGDITPGFAVRNGLMYLRGKVINNSYTTFKSVIFNNAPNQTVAVDTMCYEVIDSSVVIARLLVDNTFAYVGPNNSTLRLNLDSVPVIRLY